MGKEILAWLAQFGVALGLYFCFAARVDGREALIGAVVAALAAYGSHVVLRERVARFAAHGRLVVEAWRLPKYAVLDTWTILFSLVRQLFTGRAAGSSLLEVPFDTDGDDADAATRRALLTTYNTITPNLIVLGFDDERRRMIYHQIQRSEIPEMTRRLGARP